MSEQLPGHRRLHPGGTFLLVALFPLLLTAAPSTLKAQVQPAGASTRAPEYRIGPGDELSVSFPFNAELNHDGLVGPDGRFPLPLPEICSWPARRCRIRQG